MSIAAIVVWLACLWIITRDPDRPYAEGLADVRVTHGARRPITREVDSWENLRLDQFINAAERPEKR